MKAGGGMTSKEIENEFRAVSNLCMNIHKNIVQMLNRAHYRLPSHRNDPFIFYLLLRTLKSRPTDRISATEISRDITAALRYYSTEGITFGNCRVSKVP